jgi:membrane fusion protein (multidrug efflux system)
MKPSKNSRSGLPVSRVIFPLLAAAVATAFAGGCSKQTQQGGGMSALEVGVYTVKTEPVTLTRKLPGRTSAYRVAEVRARVNGIVQKRLFDEGSQVREGQQLYQIDDAPYVAALESARAALARAQASLVSTQALAERYSELIKTNSISKQDYDNTIAQAKAAAADVKAGEAAVTNAAINLSYTKVHSPITGRIGKSEVTEGAYVQAGAATLMAVVQQLDPIYVDIEQAAGQALKLAADRKNGALNITPEQAAKVRLFFHDGGEYGHEGKLRFTDITVGQSTSSVLLRAEFPNPNSDGPMPSLLPGLFVRAEIIEGTSPAAMLVPQQGVSRNQKGEPTALVVVPRGDMQFVERRIIKTERTIADHWLVTGGLKEGEQVVIENLQILQRVGLNVPVKPVPAGQSIGSLPVKAPDTKTPDAK